MGSLKLILGLLFIIAVIVLGVAVVPPYWANYQFEDAINTEALISTQSSKTEDAIRDTVYKRAQELDIELPKDSIKVTRTGTNGAGSVTISVDYNVHVNVPGYPFDLHFAPRTTNKGIF
jgi:uncharacterized protein (UPF0333 family)